MKTHYSKKPEVFGQWVHGVLTRHPSRDGMYAVFSIMAGDVPMTVRFAGTPKVRVGSRLLIGGTLRAGCIYAQVIQQEAR